jgi:hypothetical protein
LLGCDAEATRYASACNRWLREPRMMPSNGVSPGADHTLASFLADGSPLLAIKGLRPY